MLTFFIHPPANMFLIPSLLPTSRPTMSLQCLAKPTFAQFLDITLRHTKLFSKPHPFLTSRPVTCSAAFHWDFIIKYVIYTSYFQWPDAATCRRTPRLRPYFVAISHWGWTKLYVDSSWWCGTATQLQTKGYGVLQGLCVVYRGKRNLHNWWWWGHEVF